jgi:hypothetical protein
VDPQAFLDQFVAEQMLAQGFPMSQEEFAHIVTLNMDRGKDMQKILREKFGVGSIREGIQKGVFSSPPAPLPGMPSLRGV